MKKRTLDEIKAMFREMRLDPEDPHLKFMQMLWPAEKVSDGEPKLIIQTGTTTRIEGEAEDAKLA